MYVIKQMKLSLYLMNADSNGLSCVITLQLYKNSLAKQCEYFIHKKKLEDYR